jgi:ketosteroid isomerase-like protein
MTTGFTSAEEAESAFYEAFGTLDLALMERVWGADDAAVCVHPGGDLLQGQLAVMQSWREIFSSAARPRITFRVLRTQSEGGIAVHLVEEMIRPGGSPEAKASRVLASNVYRLEPNGWRLCQHHASLPLMRRRGSPEGPKLH